MQVGPIHVMIPAFPADPQSDEDQLFARNFEAFFNDVPMRALRDGVIALPGREPEPVRGLKGTADFFGANYYSAACVDHRHPQRIAAYPQNAQRLTQLGNTVYPEGIRVVLRRVRDAQLGVPMYVTENGIGT